MGNVCSVCLGNGEDIYQAVQKADESLVRKILEGGFNPNQKDRYGYAAIHYAARNGQLGCLLTLLDHYADINLRTTGGAAPIILASYNCHLDVVQSLLDAGAEPKVIDGYGFNCIYAAVVVNDAYDGIRQEHLQLDVVRALLKARCDVNFKNADDFSPLHFSCEHSPPEVVRELLNFKADPNLKGNNGWTPMFLAIESKTPEAVLKMLVDHGADVNVQDDIFGLLMYCITSKNSKKTTALRCLLKLGADPNVQIAEDGWTSLHMAVMGEYSDCVQILVDAGADTTIKNLDGKLAKDLTENNALRVERVA